MACLSRRIPVQNDRMWTASRFNYSRRYIVLTSEQIAYAVQKRTYQVQFLKLVWTSPQVHVFQSDDNGGIQHILTEMTNNPFCKLQLDLGYTTSSWYDVTKEDMENFAAAFLAQWGPDTSPPWPGDGQIV